jgi:triphosphoribosyl-dephospho-CoA synthase
MNHLPEESRDVSLSAGAAATLACLWEATAPKPGNVYRGADFEDLSYADLVTSAAIIGPILEQVQVRGVGATVRAGVAATRMSVATNSNLGMLLLLAPLAAVPGEASLQAGVGDVLEALNVDDTRHVYAAIRLARPGGLGAIEYADVNAPEAPSITLVEAMRLAAERDLIARQFVNNFDDVFWTAERIADATRAGRPLGVAVVQAYLQLLQRHPDSLVARKCGQAMAREVSTRAAAVLAALGEGSNAYEVALADFDFWLRSDGHRRNPGTSADLIAAALFVLLRERSVDWPVRFY